jgi:dTDP-4-amino-4,6-dideoxygalactose transaminase
MKVNDSRIIEMFEEEVAKYAGSKYGVAVSSNTNGIFLALEYLKHKKILSEGDTISLPKQTYMSVPMSILNARLKIHFRDEKWSGAYRLEDTPIWDSAVRFTKDMYVQDSLYVVSFQYKKGISIGRGGMILTNSQDAYETLKKTRFNGRTDGIRPEEDVYVIRGWNMYMIPEQAARGLTFMTIMPEKNKDVACYNDYPDLSKQKIFNE